MDTKEDGSASASQKDLKGLSNYEVKKAKRNNKVNGTQNSNAQRGYIIIS